MKTTTDMDHEKKMEEKAKLILQLQIALCLGKENEAIEIHKRLHKFMNKPSDP